MKTLILLTSLLITNAAFTCPSSSTVALNAVVRMDNLTPVIKPTCTSRAEKKLSSATMSSPVMTERIIKTCPEEETAHFNVEVDRKTCAVKSIRQVPTPATMVDGKVAHWSCVDLAGELRVNSFIIKKDFNEREELVVTNTKNDDRVILRTDVETEDGDLYVNYTSKDVLLSLNLDDPSTSGNISATIEIKGKETGLICYNGVLPETRKVLVDQIIEGGSEYDFLGDGGNYPEVQNYKLSSLLKDPRSFVKSETPKLIIQFGIEDKAQYCEASWFEVKPGIKHAVDTLLDVTEPSYGSAPALSVIRLLGKKISQDQIVEAVTVSVKPEFEGRAEACSITGVKLYLKNGQSITLHHDESD